MGLWRTLLNTLWLYLQPFTQLWSPGVAESRRGTRCQVLWIWWTRWTEEKCRLSGVGAGLGPPPKFIVTETFDWVNLSTPCSCRQMVGARPTSVSRWGRPPSLLFFLGDTTRAMPPAGARPTSHCGVLIIGRSCFQMKVGAGNMRNRPEAVVVERMCVCVCRGPSVALH